jgi:hypothetical protein
MSDIKSSLVIMGFNKIKVRHTIKGNIISSICSPVIRNANLFFTFILTLAFILFYPVKPALSGNT